MIITILIVRYFTLRFRYNPLMATGHIYTPADNTLAARIAALKSVLAASHNLKSSLDHAEQAEWSQRLGSSEELSDAQGVIAKSLEMALADVSQAELAEAKEQGLLSQGEMVELTAAQRQSEMRASRGGREKGSESNHQQ